MSFHRIIRKTIFAGTFIFFFLFLPRSIYCFALSAVDLSVTYIERTPKYFNYKVDYPGGIPVLVPHPGDPDQNPNNDKRWPDPGELVNFSGHIKNNGDTEASSFSYKWYADGAMVKQGIIPNLGPDTEVITEYIWPWPDNLNDHLIKLVVDEENQIEEQSKVNNQLTEYTNSLSFSIWVESGLYDIFHQTANGIGTYSFEDWIQWQFNDLKSRFVNSRYPLTPEGIKERIRIDRIIVIPFNPNNLLNYRTVMQNDPYKTQTDGRWQFVSDETTLIKKQEKWQEYVNNYVRQIDHGLLHELMHQLGVIDNYRFGWACCFRISVTDKNGHVVNVDNIDKVEDSCMGLMAGFSSRQGSQCIPNLPEDHVAYYLNKDLHQRRGFYGVYLFDIPQNNYLRILDKDNRPIANAEVSLYQKNLTEDIDNIAEHQGTTDSQGKIFLENKPVTPAATITNYNLKDNPFGQISVVGQNCSFLIKILYNGYEEFKWLTIRPFNLAYWSGQTQSATYDIQTNFNSLDSLPTTTPFISPTSACTRSRGDADKDGNTTILDFEIWRYNFGRTGLNPADFDCSDTVDILDYETWRSAFLDSGQITLAPTPPF